MAATEDSSLCVSTIETSPVIRTLEVEVDAERVRGAFDRAYRDLGRRVRVRGFRPGRAPRSVLEKLYGAVVVEEMKQTLVAETLPEAVGRSGLSPVAEPSVDAEALAEGAPFRYRASLEVKPEIHLPELAGLPARRPLVEVGVEDVEVELQELRERRAPLLDEPEGTVAAPGHTLVIDYSGTVDGQPFDGGSAEGAILELGAGRAIPGFEEQLEGAAAGERREIRVAFPEDYGVANLAGKEAVFAAHVARVQRRELPELDDAFAKELGEFETLEELRKRIRADFLAVRERAARAELRRTLMGALIERTAFDLPPGMVERRLEQRLAMARQQLGSAIPEGELNERLVEWRERWRPGAERDVRETLLLEAVAQRVGCQVEESEVEERIEQMARDQGIDPTRLRRAYGERGMFDALRAEMVEEKALEFLVSNAKVEDVAGT
jgi:trigger factor